MDLERERKRLLETDAEWAALSSRGQEVDRILSFWTDDARVIAPGLPAFTGKAALRSYVEGALAIPGFHITWTTSEASLSPDGQLAYLPEQKCGHHSRAGWAAGDDQWPRGDGVAPGAGRELAVCRGHLEP
jgi:ketosteroid isomerase-like protein